MTDKPIDVRIAMPQDEDLVFNLLRLAHEENAVAAINEDKVRREIKNATERRGTIIGIIDGPARLEGIIMLRLAQWWYSEDWHLDEMCNYVHPENRRSTHARHLIEFAKWFAEEMDKPLFIGVLTHTRMEAKSRLYRRQLSQGGALFYHNATHGLLSEMG